MIDPETLNEMSLELGLYLKKVEEMRIAQKAFFAGGPHKQESLKDAKAAEQIVDKKLNRALSLCRTIYSKTSKSDNNEK